MKKSGTALRSSRPSSAARSSATGKPRHIYAFGGGRADGRADMKQLLGGKGDRKSVV